MKYSYSIYFKKKDAKRSYFHLEVEIWLKIIHKQSTSRLIGPEKTLLGSSHQFKSMNQRKHYYPARALRALELLLADSAPTVGRGKTF